MKIDLKYIALGIFALLFFSSCTAVYAQTSMNYSPIWLKQGVYAEYSFKSSGVYFNNKTSLYYNETIPAIFKWECLELDGNLAKLNVSLILGQSSQKIVFSNQVYVDVINRTVYFLNYTSIGQTRLWCVSNPEQGQNITMWNFDQSTNSTEITGSAQLGGYSQTPQSWQSTYALEGKGKTFGTNNIITAFYDLDTGVMTDGYLDTEPTLYALGITDPFRQGEQHFEATNINLGPAAIWPEINQLLPIVFVIIAFIIITLLVFRKIGRKKKRNQDKRKKS